MKEKFEDFLFWRRFQRFNRWAQICLAVLFLAGCNYISSKHYHRFHLFQGKESVLSPETAGYLRQLKEPVNIVLAFSGDNSTPDFQHLYERVKQLAREYMHLANQGGNAWIHVEFINVYQQKKRAEELSAQYGLSRDNTIIISSIHGSRQIFPAQLFKAEKGAPKLFIGEQVFTSAILDVTSNKRKKIYFLTGHGEMGAQDVNPLRGLSELEALLRQQNYDLSLLDLTEHKFIPDDADLVVSAAPQAPLLPNEETMLQEYLSFHNGRMIVMLSPFCPHGMENLFYDWGVLSDDWIVMDTGKDFQVAGGDFLIRRFASHPITQNLIDYQVGLLTGLWRPVQIDPGFPEDELLSASMLAASSETSWAKRAQNHLRSVEFDPEHDLKGPISLAIATERSIGADLGVSIPGGRLVVVGNADMISNKRLHALGNHVFFLNLVRWSLSQNNALTLPPKQVETYQIAMSQQEFYLVALKLAVIPCFLGLAGIVILFWRRRH